MRSAEDVDESLKQKSLLQMLVHLLAHRDASEELENDLLVEQLQLLFQMTRHFIRDHGKDGNDIGEHSQRRLLIVHENRQVCEQST